MTILGITFVIVILFAVLCNNNQSNWSSQIADEDRPRKRPPDKSKQIALFMKANPGFSLQAMRPKVELAFMEIQKAWSNKDLSKVRRFISDGIYQRFSTQFALMNALEQTNPLSEINIEIIDLVNAEREGEYDVLDFKVKANLRDRFICKLNPELDSGGYEEFTEYWSFLRKRGASDTDIYGSNNCPACGASLSTTAGEVCSCSHCSALVNSGEFDWVLSEITQADDYTAGQIMSKAQNLEVKAKDISERNPDFSRQLLEDKVSSAYFQIAAAKAFDNPLLARRFLSDEAYSTLAQTMQEKGVLYNRLYLKEATVISILEQDGVYHCAVLVTACFQRVIKLGGALIIVDKVMNIERHVFMMNRKIRPSQSKGSLYVHLCPACGGPVKDSIDLVCPYCAQAYNSSDREWIVDKIIHMWEYNAYATQNKSRFELHLSCKDLDDVLSIKEYVLVNLMVIFASDREFNEKERAVMLEVVHKLGKPVRHIDTLFKLAQCGRLVVRMPEEQEKREKIFEIMKRAAQIDEDVHPKEQEILDYIQERYINAVDLETLVTAKEQSAQTAA